MARRFATLCVLSALVAGVNIPAQAAGGVVRARAGNEAKMWSSPDTWGGKVPSKGDAVVIPYGSTVVLDTSTAELAGLRIDGTLRFARKPLSLTAAWVMVHGHLEVGTPSKPFRQRAVITLTGADRSEDVMGMGTRFLGVMGGTIDLHGRRIKGWTRLVSHAERGDRTIEVERSAGWKPGDQIVIASTSYWSKHDEERTIVAVDGTSLELDRPLDVDHWGELQEFAGRIVDERAEVGLLSRNVVVRGAETGSDDGFGGHTMIMEGGTARIDGVEFARMGQRNILRRYPLHFHMEGSAKGSYVKRSSIHHSSNRCLTVHGTTDLLVKGNVCFDHRGHGFFLEDGGEVRNKLIGNLGLGTRSTEEGLLPSDRRASTFWITNPDNVVKNNVAAGSEGIGFWYALPEHPTGLSESESIWPRRTPLRSFAGNVAHSNGSVGLNVDHGPRPNGHTEASWYRPLEDPTDPESAPVTAYFDDFTAYYNRDRAIWLRGSDHVVRNAILADNRNGATFASEESWLIDSLVVGETANDGTVEPWEETGLDGRALPFFWEPDAQITGFEFYDGRVGTKDSTFVNFKHDSVRPAGALGYLVRNAFAIHPKNSAEKMTFVNANPVYLAPPEPGKDGDNSKVFVDLDGSVTGTPNRAVVIDNPFLLNEGCQYREAWGAHVCDQDYVSLYIGGPTASSIKPLTLTRSNGTTQELMGCCDDSKDAVTTLLPNQSYGLDFNGSTPGKTRYVLWRGKGRSITLKIPMDASFKVTRWGYAIKSVEGPGALASASDSAYFFDPASGILHLRLVGNGDWEELRVERT